MFDIIGNAGDDNLVTMKIHTFKQNVKCLIECLVYARDILEAGSVQLRFDLN